MNGLSVINNIKIYKPEDYTNLSPEALTILNNPNAGGSSNKSEAYAMEFLMKEYGASTIKDEMNVRYFHEWWKKCDFITKIDNEQIGVSVTRAIFTCRYNPDDLDLKISNLLWKKLSGLVIARAGVSDDSVFVKSMLFVWTPDRITSNLIYKTFHQYTDETLKEEVSLVIVEANVKLLMNDFN